MPLGYSKTLFFGQHVLPGWRLTRQCNLALVAIGIAGVRDAHLTVTEIARGIPTHTDHWSKYKRIWRFLSNPFGRHQRCFLAWFDSICNGSTLANVYP